MGLPVDQFGVTGLAGAVRAAEYGLGNLDAVAGNRAVYTDETLAGAIYFDTPLAHDYILDNLVPMIELAADGEAPREYPAG